MKKIVFFTGSMGRGGAERVISILAEKYVLNGWSVKVGMLLHSIIDYKLIQGVEVVDLSDKRGINKGLFSTLYRIRRFIKKEKPDVVVTFMAQNCLLVGISTIGINFRSIMSERIDPAQVKRGILFRIILNKIYQKADIVIFQTKRARSYFNKKIQKNSVIIGNPIRVSCNVEGEIKKYIITAGRLEKQKNHKMLINAFYKFHHRYPEYILYIYGEGKLRAELETQIRELDMTEVVKLPGNSKTIHEKMARAEMFILSSDFEGLSNALLEAMMIGLPCISTNCAGSDEVIDDGKNGLLIPVKDENALLEAMEKLAINKQLANELGKNARKSILKKYSEENIIYQWEKVIEGK